MLAVSYSVLDITPFSISFYFANEVVAPICMWVVWWSLFESQITTLIRTLSKLQTR